MQVLFAFNYKEKFPVNGWKVYDPVSEYKRQVEYATLVLDSLGALSSYDISLTPLVFSHHFPEGLVECVEKGLKLRILRTHLSFLLLPSSLSSSITKLSASRCFYYISHKELIIRIQTAIKFYWRHY